MLGIPSDTGNPAFNVSEAYLSLGAAHSFTCAPYLLDSSPKFGDQVAWGESNAVVYANSVIGARTQKYADYLDICCALIGYVPATGPHLATNRRPSVIIDIKNIVKKLSLTNITSDNKEDFDIELFFPVMGYLNGNLAGGRVPIIKGFEKIANIITLDDLKSFSAAFGTSGSAALFHIFGVTPEAKDMDTCAISWGEDFAEENLEMVIVSESDLVNAFTSLDSGGSLVSGGNIALDSGNIRLVAFGNPHLSLSECKRLANLCESSPTAQGEKSLLMKHSDVAVVATIGRNIHKQAKNLGYIEKMKIFGFEFINDTCWCMLTQPVIPDDPNSVIVTNSGKYAHYAPGLVNRKVRFASSARCMESAKTGLTPSLPHWLQHISPRDFCIRKLHYLKKII